MVSNLRVLAVGHHLQAFFHCLQLQSTLSMIRRRGGLEDHLSLRASLLTPRSHKDPPVRVRKGPKAALAARALRTHTGRIVKGHRG